MSLLLHIIVTYIKANVITKLQKSHTNKEGGAHLRISSWYLLMNFKNLKNQNFEKWKKKNAGDIIFHMCTKSHNHMKYSSWDTAFWAIFCPFTPHPLTKKENQNFEKKKTASANIIILNLYNKKYNHMIYAYSDMECDRYNFLF